MALLVLTKVRASRWPLRHVRAVKLCLKKEIVSGSFGGQENRGPRSQQVHDASGKL
jgi:hypothetical protein